MTVVLDYGMGNLRSVQKAVQHLGYECEVAETLTKAERLIVPGVGAFAAAMQRLASVKDDIASFVRDGGRLLGICLGQQLLFEKGLEHGECAGLGLLEGTVRYLQPSAGNKVPNIGWCAVEPHPDKDVLAGIEPGTQFYFVHSLYTDCPHDVIAGTAMHTAAFPAAVQQGGVWGTQFHPEKSSDCGLHVLKNFLRC
ncbi:MAG TPA: imidazole glycerol phosphate synthase subunit HisH [Fimbriimonadaceae bacterium]|nr:imidazole glycerol phosphate synthase subunit HisH [Fimbriimonadaceae bacterium]